MTATIPDNLGVQTIEDGQLLYCAHPMWFPIVGYRFDVPECELVRYDRSPSGRTEAYGHKTLMHKGIHQRCSKSLYLAQRYSVEFDFSKDETSTQFPLKCLKI